VRETAAVRFVDTHAHLDDPAFDADRDAVVLAAVGAGVRRILNVGYQPEGWAASIALARRYPEISVMLGVHPQHADVYDAGVEEALGDALALGQAVAIGETGLDFFRGGPDAGVQRRAFRAQLALGRRLDLPVVIHQRAAEEALIDVLAEMVDPPRLVLHSFEGSRRLAQFALDRGAVLGIGGLATRGSSGELRSVLATVPASSVVMETDAPYLVPAGARGRRNEPANLPKIAARLAPLWGLSPQELAALTASTAAAFFRLDRRRAAPPLEE